MSYEKLIKPKVVALLESQGIKYELIDNGRQIKFPMRKDDPMNGFEIICNGEKIKLTHKVLGFSEAYRYLQKGGNYERH